MKGGYFGEVVFKVERATNSFYKGPEVRRLSCFSKVWTVFLDPKEALRK